MQQAVLLPVLQRTLVLCLVACRKATLRLLASFVECVCVILNAIQMFSDCEMKV